MPEEDTLSPPEFVVSRRYDDFVTFAQETRTWALDFRQLDEGPFEAELVQIATRPVILARCRLGRKMEQRGFPPKGYRTFGISADHELDLVWRKRTVGPSNLMVFPPGEPLDSISEPGFHVFAISIASEVLDRAAHRMGFNNFSEIEPETDLLKGTTKTLQTLRELAWSLTDTAAKDPGFLGNKWFRLALHEDFVDALLDVLTRGEVAPDESGSARRSEAVATALALIEERARDPLSVAELESHCEVSARTLRYAFEERFELSPKQYMQAYRLNKVHQDLLQGHPDETSVTEVAERWGFWHMGQLAKDYRRLFGELPSETLQRRP